MRAETYSPECPGQHRPAVWPGCGFRYAQKRHPALFWRALPTWTRGEKTAPPVHRPRTPLHGLLVSRFLPRPSQVVRFAIQTISRFSGDCFRQFQGMLGVSPLEMGALAGQSEWVWKRFWEHTKGAPACRGVSRLSPGIRAIDPKWKPNPSLCHPGAEHCVTR